MAQSETVICPRFHSQLVAEPRFKPSSANWLFLVLIWQTPSCTYYRPTDAACLCFLTSKMGTNKSPYPSVDSMG